MLIDYVAGSVDPSLLPRSYRALNGTGTRRWEGILGSMLYMGHLRNWNSLAHNWDQAFTYINGL